VKRERILLLLPNKPKMKTNSTAEGDKFHKVSQIVTYFHEVSQEHKGRGR